MAEGTVRRFAQDDRRGSGAHAPPRGYPGDMLGQDEPLPDDWNFLQKPLDPAAILQRFHEILTPDG